MIQELLGGGSANTPTGLFGERKICNPFSSLSSSSPLCPPTAPPLVTKTPIPTTNGSPTPLANPNSLNSPNANNNSNTEATNNSQNLRCPRCDSTNTKFCYYNNYNLTQPRHFCKTCRRYWTKGGTLRNVPIGGGCRKNKGPISSNSSATSGLCKSSSNHAMAKAKATLSTEMLVNDNSLFLGNGLLDHQLQQNGSNPILWSSLPQAHNSHILSLLRGTSPFSNPNPNPNPTSDVFTGVKTEGSTTPTTLGLDSYGNGTQPQIGSFTRNNHHHLNGFALGIADFAHSNGNSVSNSNILDLYQRLKSSSAGYGYCGSDNPGAGILGNMMGTTASSGMSSSDLDATTLGGGGGDHGFGGYNFMNPTAMSSWSDFPAVPIHGAYP